MGQHKTNPTAIAAKRGELQPKPKPMSKRETERLLMQAVWEKILNPYLPTPKGAESLFESLEEAINATD